MTYVLFFIVFQTGTFQQEFATQSGCEFAAYTLIKDMKLSPTMNKWTCLGISK